MVELAPRRTLSGGARVRFDVAGPRSHVTGVADLRSAIEEPVGSWPAALPAFSHPLAAVELVRGAVKVTSYGGQAVRGVSAFRYEVDLAPDKAARQASLAVRSALQALDARVRGPTLFADVWVDGRGRLLRVQLPLDPNASRPRGYSKETVAVVTVDIFDYSDG